MSTPHSIPSDVIFSPDGARPEQFAGDPGEVTKIVIGKIADEAEVNANALDWLKFEDFPNLRNLHLWGIHGLESLNGLPLNLEWLDIQNCPDLKTIEPIRSTALESLVLRGLPLLESVPPPVSPLDHLFELILTQCPNLQSHFITEWLRLCPALRRFDLSKNAQITALTEWPGSLEDVRCNGCAQLSIVPPWPPNLRRVELAKTALAELQPFPESIDYVNLGGMRQLTALPAWGEARTLFLHDSAVQMPPASQHGGTSSTNVAAATRAYFRDVDEAGPGEVKRCKIMVLGNGSAGKTCLSLNITGGNPQRTRKDYEPACDRILTTHGVEFHETTRNVPEEVTIHVWDFGGQEIYHNTHRLFLSAGTVFLLVWNPEQDGQKPDNPDDKWRPLTYWLDYIRMACPTEPRIAIICSGERSESKDELEKKLRVRIGGESYDQVAFFVIDSLSEEYQSGKGLLNEWIATNAKLLISSQGTCVPSYWAIAQDMVENRVKALQKGEDDTHHMTIQEFGDRLVNAINETIVAEPGRYKQLEDALTEKQPPYRLTPDHISRVLDFLYHSGWVFWKPDLYDGRVIIGQQWALDGIYTLLQRPETHPESRVHEHLKESGGRFTRTDLGQWGWNKIYSETEQNLLFSFLQQIHLCFTLDRNEWYWDEKREYISVNHLPSAPLDEWEMDLQRVGAPESHKTAPPIELRPFHRGHWQQLLRNLGELFGAHGRYARNAFYGETEEGNAVLIRAKFDPSFLKGSVIVESRGESAEEEDAFHSSVTDRIEKAMGNIVSGEEMESIREGEMGTPKPLEPVEVFISYTWNPFDESDREYTYEEPVDFIYEALNSDSGIRPLRDNIDIPEKGSINKFMERISDTSYAVVVYSDKYFRSPYCMWELLTLLDSYAATSRSWKENLILIEHESSDIQSVGGRNDILADWAKKSDYDLHTRMTTLSPPVTSMEGLRSRVNGLVTTRMPQIFEGKSITKRWGHDTPEDIVAWIKEQIKP